MGNEAVGGPQGLRIRREGSMRTEVNEYQGDNGLVEASRRPAVRV